MDILNLTGRPFTSCGDFLYLALNFGAPRLTSAALGKSNIAFLTEHFFCTIRFSFSFAQKSHLHNVEFSKSRFSHASTYSFCSIYHHEYKV